MCTVVFIPTRNMPIVASIRDEDPNRQKAIAPQINRTTEINAVYPKDPVGKGTWVGANQYGNIIVLLNGGFENHTKQNNYRISRGLIVKEMLHCCKPIKKWESYNLNNVEPFTLVVWTSINLYQLVWDGAIKHKHLMNHEQAHIWSSATLYNAAATMYRKQLFNEWIKTNPVLNSNNLLTFFNSYTNKTNGFVMHRNTNLKTLSFSIIYINRLNEISFCYTDCATNTTYNNQLQMMRKAKTLA